MTTLEIINNKREKKGLTILSASDFLAISNCIIGKTCPGCNQRFRVMDLCEDLYRTGHKFYHEVCKGRRL